MTTLYPLPECEAPKLEPFPHDLAADVEFLSLLNVPSAHASVFKIKIGDKFYALKLFASDRTCVDLPSLEEYESGAPETMSRDVFDQHFLPFENECRAYGRLKELGREHLAVKVHGYVAVEHSEVMNNKMLRAVDGRELAFFEEHQNLMTFLGMKEDPAMGIVKDWVDKLEMDDWPSDEGQNEYDWFSMGSSLSRMLDNLHGLHESGIVVRDLSLNQYIRGILVDLSFAWTMPHPYGPRQGWKPQWTFQSMAAADLHLFQYRIIDQWRGVAQNFHAYFPADERVRSIAKTCSLRAYDSQVEARHLRPRVGRQRPFLPIVHYQEQGLEMVQRPLHDPGDFDPGRIRKKRKRGGGKEPKGRKRVEATKRRTKGRGARCRRPRTRL